MSGAALLSSSSIAQGDYMIMVDHLTKKFGDSHTGVQARGDKVVSGAYFRLRAGLQKPHS